MITLSNALTPPWMTVIVSAIGVIVAIVVAIHAYILRRDSWRRTMADLHNQFWNDPVTHHIRCCVAYPVAYEPLRDVLIRRQHIDDKCSVPPLRSFEYLLLDDLDKFLNLLGRVIAITPRYGWKKRLWNAMYLQYWLREAMMRKEIHWYIIRFYPHLATISKKWRSKDD